MNTTLKSAAAAFAAIFAVTGFAVAEEVHIQDNSAVLENIYAAMNETRAQTFEIVMASAEERLAPRMAKIENFAAPKPAPTFVLASIQAHRP